MDFGPSTGTRTYVETTCSNVQCLVKMEYPPNNTLYINNLNEKVKVEGETLNLVVTSFCGEFVSLTVTSSSHRTEEVVVRHILSIWSDSGHSSQEVVEDERPSVCSV